MWNKLKDNLSSVKVWVLAIATLLVFFGKLGGELWLYVALALIGGKVGEYIWKK